MHVTCGCQLSHGSMVVSMPLSCSETSRGFQTPLPDICPAHSSHLFISAIRFPSCACHNSKTEPLFLQQTLHTSSPPFPPSLLMVHLSGVTSVPPALHFQGLLILQISVTMPLSQSHQWMLCPAHPINWKLLLQPLSCHRSLPRPLLQYHHFLCALVCFNNNRHPLLKS